VKSISDILNSMVQPTEQKPLSGGNQSASNQGSNSSVGSFGDVLNRLAAQNQAAANAATNTASNNTTTNSNTPSSAGFSDTQISVTEVQVNETVQTGNLNQTTLTNMENAVASLAMALAKLVNLASQAQNLNQTLAQNLIVSASGGTISASQAQQLVAQIANLKNQNSGQNTLNLTSEQQGAFLLQMMQSMVQNQQITLQPSNNQNALSNGSQGSNLLQFNFAGNQNGQTGGAQVESLSIDIQTLNLQVSSNQQTQGLVSNATPSANLTDATTQKLTQLLQQLNVTPSSTPVNIHVQSSVAATNSPELAQNFQNLVQILTQAGAGQAVLSTFLTQGKNNAANNNSQQVLTPLPQTENTFAFQSVSVTAVSETESANSALISNNNQNNTAAGQAQLLNDTLGNQNIQLTTQTPSPSPDSGISSPLATQQNTGTSSAVINAGQSASVPTTNNQPTTPIVTNVAQTALVPPTNNQSLPTTSAVANAGQSTSVPTTNNQPTTPIVTNVIQTALVQPTNNQSQSTTPVAANVGQIAPGSTTNNQPTTPIVSNVAQIAPVQPTNNQSAVANVGQTAPVPTTNNQPTTPIVTNVAQNVSVQPTTNQPTTPVVNIQPAQTFATITAEQNNQNQSGANPNSQTTLSQPEDVFSNGHLEALNGIVARFNSAVVSGQTGTTNAINNNNNINQFPTETQAQAQTALVQATTPAPAAAPIQTAVLVTPTVAVNDAANIVLNNQNTQQASNLTSNNIQSQLVEPTSPTTQQVTNTINALSQNSFAQAAANNTLNNATNPTVSTGIASNTNNSAANTVNQPTPVTSVQQVVTADQATLSVPTSSGNNTAVTAPVVTQPVTNPASLTAQNLLAASVAGETAKAAVPAQVQSNANNNNAPQVAAVSPVTAVQPVSAQGVTQASNTSETSTNLNMAGNSAKETLSDTANLQNLTATVNASAAPTVNGAANSFQSTVNTVMNNNPNGSIDSAQIMNQITQQVASQTADAKMVSRLNFQLVPESLGRVNVQVSLVDQSISARITVTNPDVREVLQQHMVDLKAALSQAGLQIDQMQVNVQGGGANLLAQYYQYQQEGSAYRESAWASQNSSEQPQTADNPGGFIPTGSNTLLNLLV